MKKNEVNENLQTEQLEVKVRNKVGVIFVELFVVVLLISIGASAIVTGMTAVFFPCAGEICGQLQVAGAITVLIGFLLNIFAAVVILLVNLFKE
jgi:hypothetical protein